MKFYKKSIFLGNETFISYALIFLIIVFTKRLGIIYFFRGWFVYLIFFFIFNLLFTFYIIKEHTFLLTYFRKIDIFKINVIYKRKHKILNKYYFDIRLRNFRLISIYPLQSDIDIIIKDLIEINPDIIIKEYKFYNDNFEVQE